MNELYLSVGSNVEIERIYPGLNLLASSVSKRAMPAALVVKYPNDTVTFGLMISTLIPERGLPAVF